MRAQLRRGRSFISIFVRGQEPPSSSRLRGCRAELEATACASPSGFKATGYGRTKLNFSIAKICARRCLFGTAKLRTVSKFYRTGYSVLPMLPDAPDGSSHVAVNVR